MRKPVGDKIRHRVWMKTEGHCWYCDKPMERRDEFTVDHIVPVAAGGTNDIDNLVPCCRTCNCSKGARETPYVSAESPSGPREVRLAGQYRGYRAVTAPEGYWTVADAMQALGIPYALIVRWSQSGAITTFRLGSQKNSPRAFRRDEVMEMARQHEQHTEQLRSRITAADLDAMRRRDRTPGPKGERT